MEKKGRLLEDKVIIVTGGGGTIGSEVCYYISSLGAKVVVNDTGSNPEGEGKDPSVADTVVERIKMAGGEAVANYDTITTESGARNIVKTALDNFGRIDGLVNCAGSIKDNFTLDMSVEDFRKVIDINLIGAFIIGRECLKHMIERGGSIINATSVAGILGNWGQSNLAAAKAGLIGLTKTWAMEFGKFGIRVNLIAPTVRSRITKNLPLFVENLDMFHPRHVAPVVAFLLSDLSKEINGSLIVIYGTKLYTYHIVANEGIMKKSGGDWSPEEIKEKAKDIFELI